MNQTHKIVTKKIRLADIPSLELYLQKSATDQPIALFIQGNYDFKSQLENAERWAASGYRVLVPNLFYGEKNFLPLKNNNRYRQINNVTAMLEPLVTYILMTRLLIKNVKKISNIITQLKKQSKHAPITCVGVSMGGLTLLKCINTEKRIDFAVVRLSGFPNYDLSLPSARVRELDAIKNLVEKTYSFQNKQWHSHLFLQNSKSDPFVTLKSSHISHRVLKNIYQNDARFNYHYQAYESDGHAVIPKMDEDAIHWIEKKSPTLKTSK